MGCVLCLQRMGRARYPSLPPLQAPPPPPVTTPCGHSFCKVCFGRAMDHSNKCPMCRTVLHVGRALACTISLKHLLERSFPDEYEARRREEAAAAASSAATDTDAAAPLPLFVMSLLLPGARGSRGCRCPAGRPWRSRAPAGPCRRLSAPSRAPAVQASKLR